MSPLASVDATFTIGRRVAFTVYGQPRPAGSKTIGRAGDRAWIRDANPTAAEWKRAVAQTAGEAMTGEPLLEGALTLNLTFILARPGGHYGKRGLRPSAPAWPTVKPDLLKLSRAVEDALTGVVYRDDAQIVEQRLSKLYGEPRCCIVTVAAVVPHPEGGA